MQQYVPQTREQWIGFGVWWIMLMLLRVGVGKSEIDLLAFLVKPIGKFLYQAVVLLKRTVEFFTKEKNDGNKPDGAQGSDQARS